MTVPAPHPLVCGLIAAALLASNVNAEALNSGSGKSFFKGVGKPEGFKKATKVDPCHVFSAAGDLKFCIEDTGWELDGTRSYGEPTLYRLSDEKKAALRVLQMREGESRALDVDTLDALAEEYAFAKGPRGDRRLVRLISAKRTPAGKLYRLEAFAQEADGSLVLLQLQVIPLDYGLGFAETTIAVPRVPEVFKLSQEQIAFDAAFRSAVQVSFNVKVKK